LLSKISDSVVRHPGDAFLPLLGAMTARHVPGTRPVRWLGWALERDMMSGHAHMAVAYFLLKVRAIEQAFAELRSAAQLDPSVQGRAAEWAVAYAPEPGDALNAAPEGPEGVPMLLAMARSRRLEGQRLNLLELATQRDPSSTSAHTLAARTLLDTVVNREAVTCHFAQQAGCLERLHRHILALERLEPNDSIATELTARLLAATGRAADGRALLSSNCSSFSAAARCWQTRITLAQDQPADLPLQDALRAYYASACINQDACIRACMWLGRALESRRDFMGALEYYNRALQSGSDNATTWVAIANAANQSGQPRRAADALRRAGKTSDDPLVRHEADRATLYSLAVDQAAANRSNGNSNSNGNSH
jgi:tetratricopeptide (TPR) repeat protein